MLKNRLIMIEIYSVSHPQAIVEVSQRWGDYYNLLDDAVKTGDIELFLSLRGNRLWDEELTQDYLSDLLDTLLYVKTEGANQTGKRAIFFLITSHPNWHPTHWRSLLPPLIVPSGLQFEPEESPLLVSAFLKIQTLQEITPGKLAEMLKTILFHLDQKEFKEWLYDLANLPAWEQLHPYSYIQILDIGFDLQEDHPEALELLLSHPCWKKLFPRDLAKLADPSNGAIMRILSTNDSWPLLASQDLCRLGYDTFLSEETVHLITTHPKWPTLTSKELANLARSVGNKYLGDTYPFFLKISEHPRWKELTKEDLDEIMEWICPEESPNHQSIFDLVTSHQNW